MFGIASMLKLFVCILVLVQRFLPLLMQVQQLLLQLVNATTLQSICLLQLILSKAVVVSGLGLIGLVTVQLLRANGCT